jgi:C4-dicarboxylate transporter, DctQ subunit
LFVDEVRMSRALLTLGDRVARAGLWIAAAGLFVIVAINGVNVVARYVFAVPFSWAEEAMLYTMIAAVFAGAVSVSWQQRHIRIDAFVDLLPASARWIGDLVAAAVMVAILIWLATVGARVTTMLFNFDQRSDAMHLPIWIPNAAIVLGVILIALMAVLRLIALRGGTLAQSDDADGADRPK